MENNLLTYSSLSLLGHAIRGGGILVLGQDQDKRGGAFQGFQSFVGEMTGVNIWGHVIEEQQIASCPAKVGNVFQWLYFKRQRRGFVRIIKPSC